MVALVLFCSAAYKLGDRLLVQINDISYTQWQLETHMLIKLAMQVEQHVKTTPVTSAAHWRTALDAFRVDMLILQELERHERNQPSAKDIAAAQRYVSQWRKHNDAEFVRLGIDDKLLTELIGVNLRISTYRQQQNKRTATTQTDWLQKIVQQGSVRFYRDSSVWIPITPPQGVPGG